MRHLLTASVLLLATACGHNEQSTGEVFGAPQADPDLQLSRTAFDTRGTLLLDNGSIMSFSGVEAADGTVEVVVEVNGMELNGKRSQDALALNGFTIGTSDPTLMTDEDRAAITRLAAALEAEFYPSKAHVTTKAEYDALVTITPAEHQLFSAVEGTWAQWPSSTPLEHRIVLGDVERTVKQIHTYADNGYYMGGSHDCWDCDWWESDCVDYKRVGHEFSGCNHANSGVSCSGTQFTVDARNHDQCVRTNKHGGHSLASAWCDDQFASAVDDEAVADEVGYSNGVGFYDWRDSSRYNNCPTSWKGASDGCDMHCQFQDSDCPVDPT